MIMKVHKSITIEPNQNKWLSEDETRCLSKMVRKWLRECMENEQPKA